MRGTVRNKIKVTPEQYVDLSRLMRSCEEYDTRGNRTFDESRWIDGVWIILGVRLEPGQYEIEVDSRK